jgi:hypothetical protein
MHLSTTMLLLVIVIVAIGLPVGLVAFRQASKGMTERSRESPLAADDDLRPHARYQRSNRSA